MIAQFHSTTDRPLATFFFLAVGEAGQEQKLKGQQRTRHFNKAKYKRLAEKDHSQKRFLDTPHWIAFTSQAGDTNEDGHFKFNQQDG